MPDSDAHARPDVDAHDDHGEPGEYLDGDFAHLTEPPPKGWELLEYGEEQATIRQEIRSARAQQELVPRLPDTAVDRRALARRTRQINFRTTPAAYDELTKAADLVDLTRTRLAAVLVRDGVARILREHWAATRRQWPEADEDRER